MDRKQHYRARSFLIRACNCKTATGKACSGLPVMSYQAESLHTEFADKFILIGHEQEAQCTPSAVVQSFVYCFCRKDHRL